MTNDHHSTPDHSTPNHSTPDVSIVIADQVQTIRLTRAAKKNALTSAMYATLRQALLAGDTRHDVTAHVLLGSGGAFSAGSDIGEFLQRAQASTSGAGGATPIDLSGPILEFIRALPLIQKPLIAAVDGLAVGVGTTLLLHCDLVYASPTATFRTPFLDLGLVPEAGSSLLAPMRMGHARAFELLALGETFTAERALHAGLINAIVPSAELEATAHAAAQRLAAKPPEALALCRRLLRGEPHAITARIDEEAAIFAERLSSREAGEAFRAFLEKRPPDFRRAKPGNPG